MRLLHTTTLELEEFFGDNIPPYVILSHTWEKDEITFQAINGFHTVIAERAGFKKIKKCCQIAAANKFDYVWIDTCCIDKSSSSELSEAINSMYQWYKQSEDCYVYLQDLDASSLKLSGLAQNASRTASPSEVAASRYVLSQSRWFTRGWTLQELLAPVTMVFYDKNWTQFGTKSGMRSSLASITRIPQKALAGASLEDFSIAQRMSWAAKRTTTRLEDRAYSLMGLFAVNMPLLYGEGERSFVRLQEEILRRSDDQTIFAWRSRSAHDGVVSSNLSTGGLLATSVSDFELSWNVTRVVRENAQPYTITNRGISLPTSLHSFNLADGAQFLGIILDCTVERRRQNNPEDGRICIGLQKSEDVSGTYERLNVRDWIELRIDRFGSPKENTGRFVNGSWSGVFCTEDEFLAALKKPRESILIRAESHANALSAVSFSRLSIDISRLGRKGLNEVNLVQDAPESPEPVPGPPTVLSGMRLFRVFEYFAVGDPQPHHFSLEVTRQDERLECFFSKVDLRDAPEADPQSDLHRNETLQLPVEEQLSVLVMLSIDETAHATLQYRQATFETFDLVIFVLSLHYRRRLIDGFRSTQLVLDCPNLPVLGVAPLFPMAE